MLENMAKKTEKDNDNGHLALIVPAKAPIAVLVAGPRQLDPVLVYLKGFEGSAKTHSTMQESVQRIAKAARLPLEAVPWPSLGFAHTTAIMAELQKSHGPRTVRVTMTALRGVLKTCWRLELMTHEAFARATDWGRIRFSTLPAGRSLSREEVLAISKHCDAAKGLYGLFLRAFFATLCGTGARVSELANALDEDWQGESLRVVRKGNKEALLPLGEVEQKHLAAWRERVRVQKTSRYLFVHVRQGGELSEPEKLTVQRANHLCERVAKKAGVRAFHPHDCRRTFITTMLESGTDLGTVQRLAGHASPGTTAIYDRRTALADAEAKRKVQVWPGQ
jgi:integrase